MSAMLRDNLPQASMTVHGSEAILAMGAMTKDPRFKLAVVGGVRRSLALVQYIHKTQVIGRKRKRKESAAAGGQPWSKGTGELSRSFHTAIDAAKMEGTYGSELRRAAVVELGTAVALGGPLRSKRGPGKKLAIPTAKARVGKGGAVWPRKRDDLELVVFWKRGGGTAAALVKMRDPLPSGRKRKVPFDIMYWLVDEVTVKPHPTLVPTVKLANKRTAEMLGTAVGDITRKLLGEKKAAMPGRKGGAR